MEYVITIGTLRTRIGNMTSASVSFTVLGKKTNCVSDRLGDRGRVVFELLLEVRSSAEPLNRSDRLRRAFQRLDGKVAN